MKNIIFSILSLFLFITLSCSSQNQYNLEIAINKHADEVAGNTPFELFEREIVTHQPAYYIENKNLDNYKYGEIHLSNKSESSHVYFILNSISEKKIVGIMINIHDDNKQSQEVQQYLEKKYGSSEIISPEPTTKTDGFILGTSTYHWDDKQNNSSVYFYRIYSMENQKQVIGYSIEIIQNDAILIENTEWKLIDWYKTRF